MTSRGHHWENVYRTKPSNTVSWYQPTAATSMDLVLRHAPDRSSAILDAGAGASVLVDELLTAGYTDVTLVDLSAESLDITRRRLGDRVTGVTFIAADLLSPDILPATAIDVWHDRAVFHFLTLPEDRERYVAQVRRVVRPGGLVIVATFAGDGPTRCSGLDVVRYSAEALHEAFGGDMTLVEHRNEVHVTPGGAPQAFTWCVLRLPDRTANRSVPASDLHE